MNYRKVKKILFLTNNLDYTNGWGRYSLDLINSLKERGIDSEVLSSDNFLPKPLSDKKNYLLFPFYALKIWRQFKDNPPDVIHALVETYGPLAMILAVLLGRPYYLTIHGSFGVKPMASWFRRPIQKLAYRKAKAVVCISNYTKRRVSAYESRINFTVIPNGVKIPEVVKEPQNRDHNLVGVGAVKKRKGFHLVIQALPEILKNLPDAKYLIVGDLSDQVYVDSLKKQAQELGVEEQVKFLGKISDQELEDLYRHSGLFVLTPVSDQFNFEGFGLVYLEANIWGLPVVGTYDNGGEEAIKNNYNGFLTTPGNKEELADRIIKTLSNKELYDTLSANAKVWAGEHSWDKIAERYLKIYH